MASVLMATSCYEEDDTHNSSSASMDPSNFDECDDGDGDGEDVDGVPFRFRDTNMTSRLQKGLQIFHRKELPYLNGTKISDQGARVMIDIMVDSDSDWGWFRVSETSIGDVGLIALARAFAQTNEKRPVLCLPRSRSIDDDVAEVLAYALSGNKSWYWLNLCGSGMSAQGMNALSAALQGNTVWKVLDLSDTSIGDEGATALASAFQKNNAWAALTLSGLNIRVEGAQALAQALTVSPSWSKLELVATDIGTKGIKKLASALEHNKNWEKLDLYATHIGDKGASDLADALRQHHNCWKVLALSWTDIRVEGARYLASALREQKCWEYLVISMHKLGSQGIKMIAEHLQETTDWKRFVLNFGMDWPNNGTAFARLAEAIGKRQEPRAWKSLVLWFPEANANVMDDLAQNLCPHQQHVNQESNIPDLFVTDETAENAMKMADYLGQCWQDMDIFFLDSNNQSSGRANAMIQVGHTFPIGRTISLHHTPLLSSRGATILAGALSTSRAWTRFALSFSRVGDGGAAILAEKLNSNVNAVWQCFDLSNTVVSDSGAQMLGLALHSNKTWEVLSIASTPITDAGVHALSMALVNREWHTVDVGFTKMGDEGIEALSRALVYGKSKSWRHLRMANTIVEDTGVIALALVLQNNTTWRIFDVGHTRLSNNDFASLASFIGYNSTWETFDLRNSNLSKTDVLGVVTSIASICPSWSSIDFQSGELLCSVDQPPAKNAPVEYHAIVPAKVQSCLLSQDTYLELAIKHGLSKIENIEYDVGCFRSLAKALLDIADSLAKINSCRIGMAELHGKHRPSKLSSSRQDMVQKIHCFGLQLAAAIFQLVLDDRRKPMYDVFISFAGQDRDDYVTLLRNEMPREWDIFLDHESMQAGLTSDPTRTMLEHLLTAKVVVSVASVHYVQKKWPMAEMLCGLARNMAAGPHGRSPLIVDAMPGGAKLRAMDHDPSLWLEDLTVLIPTPLPSMQKYNKGSDLLQHCRVITKLAVDSRRQYIHLASVGGDLSSAWQV